MKSPAIVFTLAAITAVSGAYADDEMMGTYINGRMETRTERSARVADPQMDREIMLIDRQRRAQRAQERTPEQADGEMGQEDVPFEYKPNANGL
ncbi:MAG: hypothetical protein DI582_01280 [Azospirillum brasilense]|nr:MAG: hypothetical protein DI582_01280 [Azospirillum brasilense]